MISHRLWQEDLGADPNVLGRTIYVDAVPYTIVGVTPPDFQFWWRPSDIWVPVSLNPTIAIFAIWWSSHASRRRATAPPLRWP